jgi:hypothetical protein
MAALLRKTKKKYGSGQMVEYDAGLPGITVAAALRLNGTSTTCEAKVDTGSTYCLFARCHGEALGFNIESGFPVGFAADDAFQRNVLGRRGFLEQMMLGLVDYEGKLYLSRYGEE